MQALLLAILSGAGPILVQPGSSQPTGSVSTGACATQVTGDVVCYDNNGAHGGQLTSTTDPDGLMIRPQACSPSDGTCTAGNVTVFGGQDTTTIAIDGADPSVSCAGDNDTVTVTVTNNAGSSTATILTEGTDWTAAASVATTCASLATAVNALAGVSASCTSPDVRISLDTTTGRVKLEESTAGCTTVATGTTGAIVAHGDIQASTSTAFYLEDAASSATNPTLVPDRASPTAGIGGTSGDVSIITSGTERINVDTAGLMTTTSSFVFGASVRKNDNVEETFGTSDDFSLRYATGQTPDSMMLGVSADSRAIVVTERADINTDFAHPLQTHPTIFTHTANASPVTEFRGYAAAGMHGELFKTLTETTPTSVVQIPVASGSGTSGVLTYTVYAADATNHQVRSGHVLFSVVNEAGTETCVLGTPEELDNTPTGTLTATVACSTTPANAVDLTIDATSSLTQTTLRAYYHVNVAGPGNPLPQ